MIFIISKMHLFYQKAIFDYKIGRHNYTTHPGGKEDKNWRRSICSVKEYSRGITKDNTTMRAYATEVQTQLIIIRDTMKLMNQVVTTNKLRRLLARCRVPIHPDVRQIQGQFRGQAYSARKTYLIFAKLFPSLQVTGYKTQRYEDLNPDGEPILKATHEKTVKICYPTFPTTDLLSFTTVSGGENIVWRTMTAPVLVFEAAAYAPGMLNHMKRTIINGRYTLFAVIVLDRVGEYNPDDYRSKGSHYTSYIKKSDNIWYYYNDLYPSFETSGPPSDKILFGKFSEYKPALYFYNLHSTGNGPPILDS